MYLEPFSSVGKDTLPARLVTDCSVQTPCSDDIVSLCVYKRLNVRKKKYRLLTDMVVLAEDARKYFLAFGAGAIFHRTAKTRRFFHLWATHDAFLTFLRGSRCSFQLLRHRFFSTDKIV